jgi:magnesium transporter
VTKTRKQRRLLATRLGASPGVLAISPGALPTKLRLVRFDREQCDVRETLSLQELEKLLAAADEKSVAWIDVVGLGSEDVLTGLRALFHLPYLAMADVVNVPQRPKLEVHNEGMLVVMLVPRPLHEVDLDQVSFFATKRAVVSFREHEDDVFAPLLQRVKDPESRLRSAGPDYILYRLMDAAFDAYFPHLDRLSERLDAIEAQAVEHPSAKPLRELYAIRRELGILLRAALPTRDVFASAVREGSGFFTPEVVPYVRDVFDHAAQVVELAQHHRQAAGDIQELVVANLDLKMNQVMKVLTAVTVIFIPLSFVTGLYGMNFKNMPELDWKWGYPIVLGLLALIAIGIVARLRKAGWMRLEEE